MLLEAVLLVGLTASPDLGFEGTSPSLSVEVQRRRPRVELDARAQLWSVTKEALGDGYDGALEFIASRRAGRWRWGLGATAFGFEIEGGHQKTGAAGLIALGFDGGRHSITLLVQAPAQSPNRERGAELRWRYGGRHWLLEWRPGLTIFDQGGDVRDAFSNSLLVGRRFGR